MKGKAKNVQKRKKKGGGQSERISFLKGEHSVFNLRIRIGRQEVVRPRRAKKTTERRGKKKGWAVGG